MPITPTQQKAIARAMAAAEACRSLADQCASVGCFVLAREYEYFSKSILERCEWQRQALEGKDPAANQTNETEK